MTKSRVEELTDLLAVLTKADGSYHREIGEVYAELKRELAMGAEHRDNPFGNAKFPPDLLATYTAEELADEIERRKDVEGYIIGANGSWVVSDDIACVDGKGPARVIVVNED